MRTVLTIAVVVLAVGVTLGLGAVAGYLVADGQEPDVVTRTVTEKASTTSTDPYAADCDSSYERVFGDC